MLRRLTTTTKSVRHAKFAARGTARGKAKITVEATRWKAMIAVEAARRAKIAAEVAGRKAKIAAEMARWKAKIAVAGRRISAVHRANAPD